MAKRAPLSNTSPFDDNSDDERETMTVVSHKNKAAKSSGACVHCKSLKVRCEFLPGEAACQRCQAGNYPCQPRSRKKRKPAPTHEDLQEKAHNQDLQIQSLLLRFDQLKAERRVKDWIRTSEDSIVHAGFSLPKNLGGISADGERCKKAEVAAVNAYAPSHGPSLLSPPDIVKHCSLYPEEIDKLFEIYFERINPYFSLLDPDLHTPAYCIWTCPFLFTTICATAARHYTDRPGLYPLATHFARDAAGKALIDGSKSVDVIQAYMILSVYPVPAKKWVEDRSWLFMGVAIRMAIELELNQAPPSTCSDREALNRTRTWLNCYCADGSHAIQFGKLPMLELDDYLASNSQDWYRSSSMNLPYDVHLCAYVQLLIIMAKWRATMAEVQNDKDFDIIQYSLKIAKNLGEELNHWVDLYAEEYTYKPLLVCAYRGNTTQMITAYLRLVTLAVGFRHAMKTGVLTAESDIFIQVVDAARTVIQITIERLYPTGHLRNAMEANFVYVAFAGAFLVNLLRPRFRSLLDERTHEDIILTVRELIDVLSSKRAALDGRHTPALYSRFLASLLKKYDRNSDRDGQLHLAERSPPDFYSWPDIGHSSSRTEFSQGVPGIYPSVEEHDMDFSLGHFVRSVTQNSYVSYATSDTTNWHDNWGIRDAPVSQWPLTYSASNGWT